LQEDSPFKVLAAGNQPDFRTISDFRKIHIETLQNLFEQVLEPIHQDSDVFRQENEVTKRARGQVAE